MKNLPKIELHLHLEGAAPPAFIRDRAAHYREDVSRVFGPDGSYLYDDFLGFLRVYEAATAVIRSPADYAALLDTVLEGLAEQNVAHAEFFISPEFCGGGDLSAWRDYLAAMTEIANTWEARGLTSRAIVTPIRHFGPERARQSAICAAETGAPDGETWVAGLGLGGDENAGEASDFRWSYDCAREAGLGLTCHAGEWRGPDSIRDALTLGISRIGHGVRAIEDARLVEYLAEQQIHLEICPGSNIVLGVYKDLRAHPVDALARAGVRCSISTDDPPFFHSTLTGEYEALNATFGWEDEHFKQRNLDAADAAFCTAQRRSQLREIINATG